ncbi:hypothetical protein [Pseudomonas khavaziana]|uniref:hypothetical protein n=1 Tax=Pseudomonas khavaziana TaxID=2842351 RepID=UPI001CEDF227|nr:hypothetical protein [Pseudomonas khavaziana]
MNGRAVGSVFLLLTRKVERQWRQLCCLGTGSVQQEKLLLQTNNFCGGWHRAIERQQVDSDPVFLKKDVWIPEEELIIGSAIWIPKQNLYSTMQLCVPAVRSRCYADNEGSRYVCRTNE